LFTEDGEQGVMIDVVITSRDVSFDEPHRPGAAVQHFREGRMTTALWSKPMTMSGELRFIVGFKNQTKHFLNQFV
jgi:hypothetical protein